MVLCDLQDYLKYSCKIAESVLLFPLKLFVFVNNIYCDLLQTSQIQWNDKNKGMLIFDKNSLFLQLDIVNSLYISQCQQVLQLLYLCYNNQQFLKQLLKRISYSQIEANNLQECLIQIIKNTKSPQILFTYSRYPECLISLKEALLGSFSAELLQEPSFNAVPLSQQYQPQIFKRIKDLDLTVKYIVQCQFLIQRILSYDPDCSCFDGCVILNQKGRFIYNINETSDNEKNVISLFLQTWFGGKNYCNIEDIPVFIIDKDNVQSNELISTLTEEEEFSHTSQMRKYTELDMMIFGILLGAEWKIYKNGTIDKGIFCCQ
ncbi:hypothetical protein SS50377_25279 [Spironucleus salmonicida]|nr:hypothetical protein SS50377_25279 [Spironucleus salmonicida]